MFTLSKSIARFFMNEMVKVNPQNNHEHKFTKTNEMNDLQTIRLGFQRKRSDIDPVNC